MTNIMYAFRLMSNRNYLPTHNPISRNFGASSAPWGSARAEPPSQNPGQSPERGWERAFTRQSAPVGVSCVPLLHPALGGGGWLRGLSGFFCLRILSAKPGHSGVFRVVGG